MTIKEPWRTSTRLMFLNQTMHALLMRRGNVKRMLDDYQGALEDLDKADVLEPNDAFTLSVRGKVKRMLDDYQGALEDLDKADVLEPNHAFTLTTYAHTNWSLNKYQAAMEAMDKLHFLKPNDDFILQTRKWLKWMLDEYQPIIESLPFNSSIQPFTYNELNFGLSLGKGAYGEVYQSCWKGIPIAIKILEWSGNHNEGAKKSFISEVNTLGSIQHINLVRLLGYCIEGLKHMLVYEYISNSSIDKWLDGDNRLDWDKRICIIIGVAQGLAHLHHKCDPAIVHLDIKPGNILLDKDYTPKLSDFGLAKKLHGRDENVIALASTSRPGTSGYMAPEIHSNQASTKSDMYSFGVLLIRLVNGSPLRLDGDEILIRHFIQWVQEVQKEEDGFQQIFDVVINNSIVGFDRNEAKSVLQISLQCIKENPNQRPEMQKVLQLLEGLNKKKGLQYIPTLIQESFNTLSKRFGFAFKRM
ncbi:hypothetical protein BDL97_07G003500 [Sphagnum fallax]|nr:hypothetical protein BDL97_07G003500 [Sphagnum fallax]